MPSPLTLLPWHFFPHPYPTVYFFLSLPPPLCRSSGPLCSCLCSRNLKEKMVYYFRRLHCAVLPLSNPKPHLSSLIWSFVRVDVDTKDGPQEARRVRRPQPAGVTGVLPIKDTAQTQMKKRVFPAPKMPPWRSSHSRYLLFQEHSRQPWWEKKRL